MAKPDQEQRRQWREALTRLTRLAQRQPEARDWLGDMLRRNMPAILATAFEVAEESGEPLPEVLARVLSADASVQTHETVARTVPIGATVCQDLAIGSLRALLDRDSWPAGQAAPVRRHALRVALANRLAAAGRLDEARPVAEQAVAAVPEDSSSLARSIDAYDVLAQCQIADGDPPGAVDSARRALALRASIDDPFRGQVEGEQRLGLALLAAGRPGNACRMLVNAVSRARDLLASHRDPLFGIDNDLAAGADAIHVVITMGWNPNGFDEIIVDQGFRIGFRVREFHVGLTSLLTAIEKHGQRLSDDMRATVLTELAAAFPLLRRGLADTKLRIRILRLLGSGPVSLMPAISEDEFDTMADEALVADDVDLAAFVRKTEADYLRRQEPVDRRALTGALAHLSRLIPSADAVAVMREAVEVTGDDDPVARAFMLHNLARRLGANGQPAEGFAASSQAVAVVSDVFATSSDIPLLAMAGLFETLVQRGQESGMEIAFHPRMVAAAEKMLDDAGRETGADLARLVSAICGLFDSAMRQDDKATAELLANAASRLATLRPDDEATQLARGLLASQLLWAALESGTRERAREWLPEVAAAAGSAPHLERLTVELGKCVADLINAYWQAGDIGTTTRLAREWQTVLLSEAYLAVRRRDLGRDQAEYVDAIMELAAGGS